MVYKINKPTAHGESAKSLKEIFMNMKNNKRKRESMQKIEQVLVEFLQTKELNQISVSDICKKAGLNRSTFYANYIDIYIYI